MSFSRHFKLIKKRLSNGERMGYNDFDMLLNNLYSLVSFQVVPHVAIIYLKHCHVNKWKIYNINIFINLKIWKPNIVYIFVICVNLITPNLNLILKKRKNNKKYWYWIFWIKTKFQEVSRLNASLTWLTTYQNNSTFGGIGLPFENFVHSLKIFAKWNDFSAWTSRVRKN